MDAARLRTRKWLILLLLVLLVAGAGVSIVLGQSGGGYDLEWNVVSASDSMISTAFPPHALSGSAGQPGVGGAMTGGNYSLAGGFWVGAQPLAVYLPVIRR